MSQASHKQVRAPGKAGRNRIRESAGDKAISAVTYVIYALFAFVCVYPFYILSSIPSARTT